jgi:5-methylcytosine-specific restriction enzyme subunit McrC
MNAVAEQVETAFTSAEGFIGHIPVRNLWLLMLYASDLFRTCGIGKVGLEDSPDDLPDLVAEILAHAIEVRQRRRLSFGYRSRDAALNRVRGRIDILTTERHQLLDRGLVACRFDELTIDTSRNRFVRATLETISRIVHRKDLSHRCRSLATGMKVMGVSGEAPTHAQMSTDRFGRNDADDRFLVAAAKLAFYLALPTEASGANALSLPDREATWVRRLFERAVGGFYEVVLSPQGWKVQCGGTLRWRIEQKTAGIGNILPTMRTDVVLNHPPTHRTANRHRHQVHINRDERLVPRGNPAQRLYVSDLRLPAFSGWARRCACGLRERIVAASCILHSARQSTRRWRSRATTFGLPPWI